MGVEETDKNGFSRKIWLKRYCAVYTPSKHGIERIELFESEEAFVKQNPTKIIPLTESIEVSPAPPKQEPNAFEAIIDIDWGAFGDGVLDFMKSKFEKAIDDRSPLLNNFIFEELLSGKYLGDLVKQVLVELINMKVLFPDTELKSEDWTFTAADVQEVLQNLHTLDKVQELMKKIGFTNARILDAETVHYACALISVQGSLLVSICLAVILKHMDKDDVKIAVDGSMFQLQPKYKKDIHRFMADVAPDHKFQLILAEDESGKVAGLVSSCHFIGDKSVLHA